MQAEDWDARYAAAQQWSDDPNALAASLLADVPAGRALDVAAGEGRMALWLAARGSRRPGGAARRAGRTRLGANTAADALLLARRPEER